MSSRCRWPNSPNVTWENFLNVHQVLFRELNRAERTAIIASGRVPWESGWNRNPPFPEFQSLRQPGTLMAAPRSQLQMARGDLDAALWSMTANYQLSRNLNKGGLFITSLIGVAITSITRQRSGNVHPAAECSQSLLGINGSAGPAG